MNEAYRKNVVLAMDMIASCINNEDFFDIWLECGVADGDIPVGAKGEDVPYYYIDDDTFADILGVFLRCMRYASKDGGLYCDGVVSK